MPAGAVPKRFYMTVLLLPINNMTRHIAVQSRFKHSGSCGITCRTYDLNHGELSCMGIRRLSLL